MHSTRGPAMKSWISDMLHRLNGRLPRPSKHSVKVKRYTSSGVSGDEFYAHAYNNQHHRQSAHV